MAAKESPAKKRSKAASAQEDGQAAPLDLASEVASLREALESLRAELAELKAAPREPAAAPAPAPAPADDDRPTQEPVPDESYRAFDLAELEGDILAALGSPEPFPWDEFNSPEAPEQFEDLEEKLTQEEQDLRAMLERHPSLCGQIKNYNTENPPDYVLEEPLTVLIREEDPAYLGEALRAEEPPSPAFDFSQGLTGALAGHAPPLPPDEPDFGVQPARPAASLNPDEEALAQIPARLAMRALALPLRVGDGILVVAAPMPFNQRALGELAEEVGMEVKPAAAPLADVVRALRECYAEDFDEGFRLRLLKGAAPKAEDSIVDRLLGWLGVERKAA